MFKKILIIFVVVVVVLIGGSYAAISIPKKVNVTWTEQDLQSYMQKAKAQIFSGASSDAPSDLKPASLEDLLFDNFIATGVVEVEGVVTSSEASAMVNSVIRDTGIFKDIRIGFREDGTMEASAYLDAGIKKITELIPETKKYESLIKLAIGKPIYWRYSLERIEDKKFDGHTLQFQVGQVPIPLPQAREGLKEAGSALNNMIAKIDGFTCESLSIDQEGFHFKGTLPDKLEYENREHLLSE